MGIIYFIVILIVCVLGAIVGIGGGLFIRPIFDAIGYHNVLNISFFSSSAILTMAVVSTLQKVKDGMKIGVQTAILLSTGAVIGGMLGNLLLEHLVATFTAESNVQMVQIVATVLVLVASLWLTAKSVSWQYELKSKVLYVALGVISGVCAAFLGIGGGPINVPLMMIFFGLPIKAATAYSIVIIFFSHFSRIITMGVTVGYAYFDLKFLAFVIPAAALGGFLGAKCSKIFSEAMVKKLFIGAVSLVIAINIANAIFFI